MVDWELKSRINKDLLLTASHSLRSSPTGRRTASRRLPLPRVASMCFLNCVPWKQSHTFSLQESSIKIEMHSMHVLIVKITKWCKFNESDWIIHPKYCLQSYFWIYSWLMSLHKIPFQHLLSPLRGAIPILKENNKFYPSFVSRLLGLLELLSSFNIPWIWLSNCILSLDKFSAWNRARRGVYGPWAEQYIEDGWWPTRTILCLDPLLMPLSFTWKVPCFLWLTAYNVSIMWMRSLHNYTFFS